MLETTNQLLVCSTYFTRIGRPSAPHAAPLGTSAKTHHVDAVPDESC